MKRLVHVCLYERFYLQVHVCLCKRCWLRYVCWCPSRLAGYCCSCLSVCVVISCDLCCKFDVFLLCMYSSECLSYVDWDLEYVPLKCSVVCYMSVLRYCLCTYLVVSRMFDMMFVVLHVCSILLHVMLHKSAVFSSSSECLSFSMLHAKLHLFWTFLSVFVSVKCLHVLHFVHSV